MSLPSEAIRPPTVAAAADQIARSLEAASGPAEDPLWSGPDIVGDEADWRIEVLPVSDGLYGGAAGIALFLAASRAPGAGRVAARAAEQLLRKTPDLISSARLDLAGGAAGVAYAVAWIGHLLGREDLVAGSRQLAVDICDQVDRMPAGDLLSGSAGTILALLSVGADQAPVVERARAAARRLAGAGREEAWGRSWPDAPAGPGKSGPAGLLGLGHGTSGIALALTQVAALTADDDLHAAARAAIEYESSWCDPRYPGWPDLRQTGSQDGNRAEDDDGQIVEHSWPTFWCHGAAGIGISRARLHTLQPDPALLADLGVAVQAARQYVMSARAALRDGRTTDCSLCHGLAGVAELFLAAAELPGGAAHLRAARRVGELMLDLYSVGGRWPSGLPDQQEALGLFVGNAGIGLTLLRLADPSSAPSPALPTWLPEVTRRTSLPGGPLAPRRQLQEAPAEPPLRRRGLPGLRSQQ